MCELCGPSSDIPDRLRPELSALIHERVVEKARRRGTTVLGLVTFEPKKPWSRRLRERIHDYVGDLREDLSILRLKLPSWLY